jgi:uncharacterized damage-inducible protein DinB
MTSTAARIADNLALLDQLAALVRDLASPTYVAPAPPPTRGGIGGHVRHILGFYECFLRGLPDRRVDYEARDRDRRAELDPRYALERIREAADRLAALGVPCGSTQLLVRAEGGSGAGAPSAWGRSSIARELEFLMSHTIHHVAIVAILLRLHGVDPGDELGVAPSTLAYWRRAS